MRLNGKRVAIFFKGKKGDTGAKIVSTEYVGLDQYGGRQYMQTFDNGTTAFFVAPKGDTPDLSGCAKKEDLPLEVKWGIDFGVTSIEFGAVCETPFSQFTRTPVVGDEFNAIATNVDGNVYYVRCHIEEVEATKAAYTVTYAELLYDKQRIDEISFFYAKKEDLDECENQISALKQTSIATVQMTQEHDASISALNGAVAECAKTEDLPLELNIIPYVDRNYTDGEHISFPVDDFNRMPSVGERFKTVVEQDNGNMYLLVCEVYQVLRREVAVCYIATSNTLRDTSDGGGTKLYCHTIPVPMTPEWNIDLKLITLDKTAYNEKVDIQRAISAGRFISASQSLMPHPTLIDTGNYTIYYFENGSYSSITTIPDTFTDTVTEL